MTKSYMVVLTIFILLRYVLEVFGVTERFVSELSVTRLLFFIPILLGLSFTREPLGGLKEMITANIGYVSWGVGLVDIIHVVDGVLGFGTHYGGGINIPHFVGHLVEMKGLIAGGPPQGPRRLVFCEPILLMTIIASIICYLTFRLNQKGESPQTGTA